MTIVTLFFFLCLSEAPRSTCSDGASCEDSELLHKRVKGSPTGVFSLAEQKKKEMKKKRKGILAISSEFRLRLSCNRKLDFCGIVDFLTKMESKNFGFYCTVVTQAAFFSLSLKCRRS